MHAMHVKMTCENDLCVLAVVAVVNSIPIGGLGVL